MDGQASAGDQLSPGRTLAKLRAERNLSIADVAQRLKYGVRQIEALESDDFQKLPGTTFVRGMIRSYAKLLDGNPAELLLELDRRRVPDQVTVDFRTAQIPFPDGNRRSTRVYAVLSILLVLAAGVVAYEWQFGAFSWVASEPTSVALPAAMDSKPLPVIAEPKFEHQINDHGTTGPQLQSISESVGAEYQSALASPSQINKEVIQPAPIAFTNASGGGKRIALQFDNESWVEIRQGDGKVLMSQLNLKGTRQLVEGVPPFILVIGNASNVRLSYNEMPVDLRPHFKMDVARLVLE